MSNVGGVIIILLPHQTSVCRQSVEYREYFYSKLNSYNSSLSQIFSSIRRVFWFHL